MQRIDGIKATAQLIGDVLLDGTPASVTGSSLTFNQLIQGNTIQLAGHKAYVYSGAGAGQDRVVGSLITGSRTIIFTEVFGSVPSVNSSVLITKHFSKSVDYDAALDRFIGKAKTKYLVDKVATMSVNGSQYEYPVPSGFEYVSSLQFVPSGNTDYSTSDVVDSIFELTPRFFRIVPNAVGTYVFVVDPRKVDMAVFNQYWVNVKGQMKPEVSGTDNAVIPADLEEYVVTGAAMLLASQRIDEATQWKTKYNMFKDAMPDLEDYIFRHPRGVKVRS